MPYCFDWYSSGMRPGVRANSEQRFHASCPRFPASGNRGLTCAAVCCHGERDEQDPHGPEPAHGVSQAPQRWLDAFGFPTAAIVYIPTPTGRTGRVTENSVVSGYVQQPALRWVSQGLWGLVESQCGVANQRKPVRVGRSRTRGVPGAVWVVQYRMWPPPVGDR